MKLSIPRLLIPLLILLAIDIYVFQAFRTILAESSEVLRKWVYMSYWLFTAIAVCFILAAMVSGWQTWPRFIKTYAFAIILIVYLSKLIVLPFLAIDDLLRAGRWVFSKFSSSEEQIAEGIRISRSQFIMGTGLILGAIPFSSLTYGLIRGPYNFRVRKKKLRFKNLPEGFDGIRILQLSDIHTGSWIGPEPMRRAVDMVNAQKADLVLFTGDLVNEMTEEAGPFVEILKQIKAPMGVYSTLGNHDYGDYMKWPDEESKRKNFTDLLDTHKSLGWYLMRNENVTLERNGDKLVLAGCENWSASNRFPKYGDLNKTLEGAEKSPFTILMSHDPSHWDAEILKHPHKVDITLAGHTHGMQFGVDFKWYRWSPAQWFYKQWADLYNKEEQYIYVNRGLGFVGYPGRVGVQPEITVLELHRG